MGSAGTVPASQRLKQKRASDVARTTRLSENTMLRARIAFAAALLSLAVPSFASITGVIIDRDGKPITGARVSMFALETRDARRERLMSKTPERVPLATINSDSKGAFTLATPKDAVVDLQAD